MSFISFFFNDTATTEIYTLSLHDALPIYKRALLHDELRHRAGARRGGLPGQSSAHAPGTGAEDRKSTRLNSSHANISYAVFCLKKKMYQETSGIICPSMRDLVRGAHLLTA